MENPLKARIPSYMSVTSSPTQAIKWGFNPTTSLSAPKGQMFFPKYGIKLSKWDVMT